MLANQLRNQFSGYVSSTSAQWKRNYEVWVS